MVVEMDIWSISVFDQHGQHKRLHAAHEGILGPIYSMITLLLRMKPNEHEFKVMGLAPCKRISQNCN